MEIYIEIIFAYIVICCMIAIAVTVTIVTAQNSHRWLSCKTIMETKFPGTYTKVTDTDSNGLCCADIGMTKNDHMLSIENKCMMVKW